METKDEYDVFISYNWSIKNQVKKLYDILKNFGYHVWQDDRELETSNKPLTLQLAKGIKKSKVFLSCITNDYCKSYNCNLEVEFANAKAKQMIVLMIENIKTTDIDEIQINGRSGTSGIGFIIT